ncbi:MAG: leucine-rich repeat domain-containing protein [Roseburia sp.]|nr:leucine-rich repeat domain-containing protein [Roseburia sp.]
MTKRNKFVLIFLLLAAAICAFAFSACATIGYGGGKDVPEIKKNEVLFIERNRLSFALGMEIDEIDVLERCNISFVSEDGSFTVTAESLRSGMVQYESFELDKVGSNKQIALSYGDAVNYIYYDVNSYKANFYLDGEKTELYKSLDASAELTETLGLSVWVNLVRQNYSTDERVRETDEDRAIKFDGWYDSFSNRATGLYVFAPPKTGNEVVANFTAGFISDGQADEMNLYYDDDGRRVFAGYTGNDDTVRVPEGVTYVDFDELCEGGSPVKELRLPSTLTLEIPFKTAVNSVGLERVTVDGGNLTYASYNGALYSKDYSTLYFMPSDCPEKEFHPSLTEIASYACAYWRISGLEIPENVTTLNHYCFAYSSLSAVSGLENVKNIKAGVFFGSNIETYSDGKAQYILLDGENDGKYILSMITDESITGYTVAEGTVAVSGNVFSRCKNLVSIDLGTELKEIGPSAFSGCTKLKSVELPASLEKMGENVFYGCTSLTSVTGLPDVTYVDENGREYAHCLPTGIFYGCKALTTAPLPEGLLQIGATAFYQCSKISEVNIPDTVYYIGGSAFAHCTALKTINLPTSLRGFGNSVFYYSGLTEINLTVCENLTELSASLFYNTKLTEIFIPDKITYIPDNCLRYIRTLKKVDLNKVTELGTYALGQSLFSEIDYGNLVTIGTRAFSGCTNLTSVELPDTVTYIGAYAFGSCTKLQSISLGKNVQTFGEFAFAKDGVDFETASPATYSCTALKSITVAEGNEYFKSIDGALYGRYAGGRDFGEGGVLYCLPCAYAQTEYTAAAATRLILPYAVHNQTTLQTFTCNEGLKNIGKAAFFASGQLVTVNISSTVTVLGANITLSCPKATTFTIAEGDIPSYYTDGRYVYSGDGDSIVLAAGAPAALTIEDGVKTIAMGAFMKTKITEITIPDSVERIEEKAFNDCSDLVSLHIGSGLRYLDSTAFSLLQKLETITVSPDNPYFTAEDNVLYTKDGKGVVLVAACNGMTEVKLKSGVTEIWDYAFSCHQTLASIVLPEGLKSVGDYSFYDCKQAAYLYCNRSLESIGDYAFSFSGSSSVTQRCNTLKTVVFYDKLTHIGDSAFFGHYGIELTCFKMTWLQRAILLSGAGSNNVFFTRGCSDGKGGYYNNNGNGIIRAMYSETETTITHDGYEWFYFENGVPKLYE